MRISDWSSDVCSSDLWRPPMWLIRAPPQPSLFLGISHIGGLQSHRRRWHRRVAGGLTESGALISTLLLAVDRKSVLQGKSVSVRLDLGGRRIFKKNT